MRFFNFLCAFLLIGLMSQNLSSRDFRVNQIPNGKKYQCSNCHVSPGGGGQRTLFGETVNDNLDNGNVRWDLIFNIDSDGDGFTNGEELLDPNGDWAINETDPGNSQDVTKVWDPTSFPEVSSIENDIANANTTIYPIPTNGILNIDFPSNYFEKTQIEVYDIAGNRAITLEESSVIGLNNYTLNIRNLNISYGTYFITIRNKYYFIRKKFTYTN